MSFAIALAGSLILLPATSGRISTFGGPDDPWVSPDETGAITGERLIDLDADGDYYIAMRWSYVQAALGDVDSGKRWLRDQRVRVSARGRSVVCRIVDWGPHVRTGRVADLSPAAARALGIETDDITHFDWASPTDRLGPGAGKNTPAERPQFSESAARSISLSSSRR